MAAHRYWRAVGLEACGAGDLELSEFHLLAAGTRVDTPATLTSNAAPDVSGVLADLQDDMLTTAARWSAQATKTLILQWDFGSSPADVGGIRLAGDSEVRFLLIVKILWSDDNISWASLSEGATAGIKWLGASTLASVLGIASADAYSTKTHSLLNFNAGNGTTTMVDATGKTWVAEGAAAIRTAQSKYGNSSLAITTAADCITEVVTTDLSSGSYTVETWMYIPALVSGDGNTILTSGSNIYPNRWLLDAYAPSSGNITVRCITGSNAINFSVSGAYTLGTFVHIAFVNDEAKNTFTTFIGGIAKGVRAAIALTNFGPLKIGKNSPYWEDPYYLDDFRITKAARYSANFTPPEQLGTGEIVSGLNSVKGRCAPTDSLTLGTGPAIIYGTPGITPPVYLGVESGCVKDYITGVLGQGVGRVRGTIKEKGTVNTPLHRKVRLIREKDGLVIREAWSDPVTGAYDFKYVDEAQTFTVISYDYTGAYRAVIADNQVPT